MVDAMRREQLVKGLVRIGEKEMTGEDDAEIDAYFAPDFRFHGPDGRQLDYLGLKEAFAALQAAFDELTITRGILIVEGNSVACQTTIAGNFMREFTRSPVGSQPPNGKRVMFELTNIFRYNDAGRLAKEWIQPTIAASCASLGRRVVNAMSSG